MRRNKIEGVQDDKQPGGNRGESSGDTRKQPRWFDACHSSRILDVFVWL